MEISRPSLEERAAECARELTFSATVAYDGAPFAGFAKQPGQLTVQGELEQALSLLFRRPVDVVCAGRTDAGVHDFKSFCLAASAVGKPTCRNVEEISIASEEILGEPHRVITVRGNAFLHSMVRTIVGTLVMVGRGQRDPDWVAEVLAARDRQAAGENAPARGLIFWSVGY